MILALGAIVSTTTIAARWARDKAIEPVLRPLIETDLKLFSANSEQDARQEKIEKNLETLTEWQKSEQKKAAERAARQKERKRIKACLDSGKKPEECL
jgi:hypothetical protein